MVAVPVVIPVTWPPDVTVAIVVILLPQVPPDVASARVVVPPTHMPTAVEGVMAAGAVDTVTTSVA